MSGFRELLIGKDASSIPYPDRKTAVLRGNLALVALAVGIGYIFIDQATGISGNEPYYAATILLSLTTLLLNRKRKFRLASIVFVFTLNLIVFLFSASDIYRSGVYIFFVVTSLTSLALFGYKDRMLALFFPVLSLTLFILSYWGDYSLMPKRTFSDEYLRINFTTNFIVAQFTSITIVYFLISVNFKSEKQILKKNDLLGKANTELDRFVYSASHDLRAPLSSILGLVHLYDLSDSDAEKSQVVGLIRERVHKMDNFIREILDYSRNSRLQIKSEKISSKELVREIIEGLRYSNNFEKISIDPGNADWTVETDPERIKVILNNLLANALKYYDPAKTNPFIKVQFEKGEDSWSATVEDNGLGIHPEQQGRIFEMFYRAHETSEGSGLGLYIAREVVQRMGGTITVKSELGAGSTFTVTLPEKADFHLEPERVITAQS